MRLLVLDRSQRPQFDEARSGPRHRDGEEPALQFDVLNEHPPPQSPADLGRVKTLGHHGVAADLEQPAPDGRLGRDRLALQRFGGGARQGRLAEGGADATELRQGGHQLVVIRRLDRRVMKGAGPPALRPANDR